MTAKREYREFLIGAGLSHKTVRDYVREVDRAEAWLAGRGHSLRTAPASEVAALASALPNTYSSRSMLRKALRRYWEMTGRRNPPIAAVRVPSKPPQVWRGFDDDEAAVIAAAIRAVRDKRAMASALALYQGMRREEIARLAGRNFDGGWLEWVAKHNVTRRLPVHPEVQRLADELVRGPGYLFPGRVGDGHVHAATIWDWVRRFASDAVGHTRRTHQFRYVAINKSHQGTGDLFTTQAFAGHARAETTAGYLRVSSDRLVAAVQAVRF